MTTPNYWQKNDDPKTPLFADLAWNIPDQKSGTVTIVGGNQQNFSTIIRTTEYLLKEFPLQSATAVLPESLQNSLPPLQDLHFLPATQSGSFAASTPFIDLATTGEHTLLIGDLSKNTETTKAVIQMIKKASSPLFLTRNTIDLITPDAQEIIDHPQIFYLASLAQLQKLFRSLYYPKMIMLSMPLLQLTEILHKFTLSYPCTIVTLHAANLLVAHQGQIITTPLQNTKYTPISLWNGALIANITAFNLYNPGQPLQATTAALCH